MKWERLHTVLNFVFQIKVFDTPLFQKGQNSQFMPTCIVQSALYVLFCECSLSVKVPISSLFFEQMIW